ncbi:VOC family protein [Glutamicibacter soli]
MAASQKEIGMFKSLLANCTVSDLKRAEQWYMRLLSREPDRRPMDGLLEWHLGHGFGLQVWHEPERAGRSTIVLEVSNLDSEALRLSKAGFVHGGPEQGGGARILQLADPDGNRIVIAGPGVIPDPGE